MGAADVVPGVSGGTVAFVSGIYTRLVNALAKWGAGDLFLIPLAFSAVVNREKRSVLSESLREKDLGFLLVLGAGIATAVLTLSRMIPSMLQNHPFESYSLFFGLILLSVGFPLRKVEAWSFQKFLFLLLTTGISLLFFYNHPSLQFPQNSFGAFLAACIAICAMILPGISGAYLLLMMGMYEFVLEALHNKELVTVGFFIAGCATGILLFVRLLNRLLKSFLDWTLIALSGLMIGSLLKIWPYQYWEEETSSLIWGFVLFFVGMNLITVTLWIDKKKSKEEKEVLVQEAQKAQEPEIEA